ncbi:MAG: DUF72 domain-containing protein [Gemmatimonadota bacterium]
MTVHAGTSGFAFKEWKGPFYPDDLPDKEMLAYYATRFATVEINNTFYRMPKESVLLDWARKVPAGFTFTIKASQRITHFTRLKAESAEHVDYLLKTVAVLGDKLGPTLFQLPPNLKLDLERLKAFVGRLPRTQKFALEFRSDTWFVPDVYAVLKDAGIPMVIIEQDDFASPVETTAEWGYVRLHKLDYTPGEIVAWARKIKALKWKDVFVYFKHDHGIGSGPPAADAFMKEISK